MAYTRNWTAAYELTPANRDERKEGALRIRNTREDIRERIEKDHYMDIGGTDTDHGEHKQVTLRESVADPSVTSGKGCLYTKEVDGTAECFWKDEDGKIVQMTSHGQLTSFVDRGEPANPDFDKNDLTFSDAFWDLDVSGIVDSGATAVLLGIHGSTNVGNDFAEVVFRKKGGVSFRNVDGFYLASPEHGVYHSVRSSIIATLRDDGVCQYRGRSGDNWGIFDITVRGWWV